MQIYTVSPFVSLSFDCATALPHPVSSAALANNSNSFFMFLGFILDLPIFPLLFS